MNAHANSLELELVTHCFQYSTLLRYHLSSLVVWPPSDMRLKITVFYAMEDRETRRVLDAFSQYGVPNITWNWQKQSVRSLCRRSIGRNLAALASTSDWVWFTDADYWFTQDCWEAFAALPQMEEKLIYPQYLNLQLDHILGDEAVARAKLKKGILFCDPKGYGRRMMRKAIGGIQIASGQACREFGYLPNGRRAQTPTRKKMFAPTPDDVWFRTSLGTEGKPVDLPGVYRLRHSQAGRFTPGLKL